MRVFTTPEQIAAAKSVDELWVLISYVTDEMKYSRPELRCDLAVACHPRADLCSHDECGDVASARVDYIAPVIAGWLNTPRPDRDFVAVYSDRSYLVTDSGERQIETNWNWSEAAGAFAVRLTDIRLVGFDLESDADATHTRLKATQQCSAMTNLTPGPKPTRPHGTRAAIRRHERAGEDLCEACRQERNRLAREMYARRQAASS